MSRLAKEYGTQRDCLLANYDRLLTWFQEGKIQLHQVGVAELQNRHDNLALARFTVGFCGQTKAGKSTLLNALVFGREVLPANDTVATAQITELVWGAEEGFDVVFYSREEWEEVRASFGNRTDGNVGDARHSEDSQKFEETLKEIHQRYGIIAEQVLGKKFQLAGYGKVHEYVAVPDMGGRYSPFVKCIRLRANHPWLKEITVVDTPGVNDPNRVRGRLTADWLYNADAVVYVTYAGQAMDSNDISFIRENMLHVDARNRIIAVNKVDVVNDPAGLEDWLRRLSRHDDHGVRDVFSGGVPVVHVCAIGALIESLLSAGVRLNEDLEFMRSRLEKKGFLEAKRHKLQELKDVIEQRLLANKGESILSSHRAFQESLFERSLRVTDARIAHTEERLRDLQSTVGVLETKLEKIRDQQAEIGRFCDEANRVVQSVWKDAQREVMVALKSFRDRCVRGIEREVRDVKSVRSLEHAVPWIVKRTVGDAIFDLLEPLDHEMEKVERAMGQQIDGMKELFQRYGTVAGERVDCAISFDQLSLHDFSSVVGRRLDREMVSLLVRDSTSWWGRLFNTQGARSGAVAAIMGTVGSTIEELTQERLRKTILNSVAQDIQNFAENLARRSKQLLDDRRKEIEEVLKQKADRQAAIRDCEAQRQSLLNRRQDLEQARAELMDGASVPQGGADAGA